MGIVPTGAAGGGGLYPSSASAGEALGQSDAIVGRHREGEGDLCHRQLAEPSLEGSISKFRQELKPGASRSDNRRPHMRNVQLPSAHVCAIVMEWTMKAAFYSQVGRARGVLQFGDFPSPVAGPGDVLIEIKASGINPADVKRRAAWNGASMPHPNVIPHSDGAGVIVAVGDGVPPARIGERVWIWNAQGSYGEPGRAFGTAAEYIALPSQQAVELSDHMSFATGACLGIPAMTAHRCVHMDDGLEGQTVLINGAAGSVGAFAVQFARQAGAHVIGTVGNAEGAARILALGATAAINRKTENTQERVMDLTAGIGVDRIIEVDFAANMALNANVLKRNGSISSYSSSSNTLPIFPYYDFAIKGARFSLVQSFHLPEAARRAGEAKIRELADSDKLVVHIGKCFSFSEIAEAHEHVETGASGHVILQEADNSAPFSQLNVPIGKVRL